MVQGLLLWYHYYKPAVVKLDYYYLHVFCDWSCPLHVRIGPAQEEEFSLVLRLENHTPTGSFLLHTHTDTPALCPVEEAGTMPLERWPPPDPDTHGPPWLWRTNELDHTSSKMAPLISKRARRRRRWERRRRRELKIDALSWEGGGQPGRRSLVL